MDQEKTFEIDPKRKRMLRLLWVVLAIWIGLLALGASLYAPAPGERDHATVDWRRGLVVLLFVGGFLGLWIWLASRQRLPRRFGQGLPISHEGSQGVERTEEQSGQHGQEDQQP